ncbi:transposase, IS4 family (plasmid) [Phaeobacter piscinae]|uniref:Transposase, IS4 family n=1 Tax=Phaeobacter piscinae TaxID=1580596 RepID=A0ABM6PJK0_9RHOB|nr:transposase, IS4 family [Phaeobacter piscinae]AUQ88337.1 transposase, IS4 family [Phaeobacter piscinae]AUR26220.1 transposase, IS4 family [Phaeobacter piscinae]
MKVLFGMALRQTTGFVESLLRLIGLDWSVPEFSTLSWRQKAFAVSIPYRGSKGPLNLLIDSGDYDRIVVVAHSLGTIVGYDILAHTYNRYKTVVVDGPQPERDTGVDDP